MLICPQNGSAVLRTNYLELELFCRQSRSVVLTGLGSTPRPTADLFMKFDVNHCKLSLIHKKKCCEDQTLWCHFVARSSSSQQHGAKENVCTPRMETEVGPLCSQDVKIHQKGVSRHDLTPEIVVARTIRHHLVAAFYCSANIYDNICPGTLHENDTINLYV